MLIKGRIDKAPGCEGWLARHGLAVKLDIVEKTGWMFHACYDALVFKKIAAILGGKVRCMVTGGAPMEKNVINFIKVVFSTPVVEGYGLTETVAGTSATDIYDPVPGHVGGPKYAVKIRLKDLPEMGYLTTDKPYPRGEICITGPTVFNGYYKRPEKTAEAFDEEGWFLTGDVGMVYPNGSIKIIDRSKNIFKTSQGEYIAPEKIEGILSLSPMIAQTFIYGDSLKNNVVGIIIPEEEWVMDWAKKQGLASASFAELCKNDQLKQEIGKDMARLAKDKKLSSLEKPKEFILHPELFSIENNMLTSTFKMKRNVAKEVMKPMIDEMYEKIAAAEANRENQTNLMASTQQK